MQVNPEQGPLIGIGRTAEVYTWGDDQVLKLYRSEVPREWVAHEANVGRIVAEAGLAAPSVNDVIELEGRLGIIHERVTGPSMLDGLVRRPWTLFRGARQFAEVHAAMHGCRQPELPGQRDALIRSIEHAPALPGTIHRRALVALARLSDGAVVCHGDYHPDNIIISSRGQIVVDWMTATHGNPADDVARMVLLFRVAVLPEDMPGAKRITTQLFRRVFLAAYLQAYRSLRPLSDTELETWVPILAAARLNEGIAAEAATLLRLAETVGIPV